MRVLCVTNTLDIFLFTKGTRQGEVKKSIGNGDAKDLTCTTHGHELGQGMMVEGGEEAEENKGEKNMGQL